MNYVAFFKRNIFTQIFQNSLWGLLSSIFQNIVFAVFFIVLVKKYDPLILSSYILSNTLYGLLLSFSTLGLGQAFLREMTNKQSYIYDLHRFISIQLFSGLVFYLLQILFSYLLYEDILIHYLSIILGINILFDNVIYVFKNVNILHNIQVKTFLVTSLEALFKIFLALFIWFYTFDILTVVSLLVLFRIISLLLFIRIGLPDSLKFNLKLIFQNIQLFKLFKIIQVNKYFILIGALSVFYWSYGNLFVSKKIGIVAVPAFEIAYKLFSMAEIIPLIFSATIFPVLIRKQAISKSVLIEYYNQIYWIYVLYGLLSFLFILIFADEFIPSIFGRNYLSAAGLTKELFCTMLIFPSTLIQANIIIAIGKEKKDMYFNLLSLLILLFFSYIIFYFVQSSSVITISIFISFFIFQLLQDIYLLKNKYLQTSKVISFYLYLITVLVISFKSIF